MTAIDTRSLDKGRPGALKADPSVDAYFRNLERILAELSRAISTSEAQALEGIGLGGAQITYDEIYAELTNTDPVLTADTTGFTADNTSLTADMT